MNMIFDTDNEILIDIDNEMCQLMKDLHKPVNQYFLSEHCMMLQNHAVRGSFQNAR